MTNFYEIDIIGKYSKFEEKEIRGSKYDELEDLFNDYIRLFFYTIYNEGITYTTNRNGLLAKVVYQSGYFINYVQPKIGEWDFLNPQYQRVVSLDFVLFLFNETCMGGALPYLNSEGNEDILSINMFDIIRDLQMLSYNRQLDANGLPNALDNYSNQDIERVIFQYTVISKILEYARPFKDFHVKANTAERTKKALALGKISYDELTDIELELVDSYDLEDNREFYPDLGHLYNYLLKGIAKTLSQEEREFKRLVSDGQNYDPNYLLLKKIYNNPLSISYDEDSENFELRIDFESAKEFETIEKERSRNRKLY